MENHSGSSSELTGKTEPTLRQLREQSERLVEEAWWANLKAKPDIRDLRDPETVGRQYLTRVRTDDEA